MSAPKKVKIHHKGDEDDAIELSSEEDDVCDEDDCEEINDEEDEEEDEMINQEIKLNFDGFSPIEDDYEGIKKLLKQLFLKEKIDLNDLTKLLIQTKDCTVIKQFDDEEAEEEEDDDDEDDDDVLAVNVVIPLNSEHESIKQIKDLVKSKTQKDDKFAQLLNSHSKIGLIISERFVNLPANISLPMYQEIVKEIKQNNDKKYDWYLLMSKILKSKTKKDNNTQKDQNQIIYVNAEEELIDELAEYRCEYNVADQCDGESLGNNWNDDQDVYVPYRKLIIISSDKLSLSVDKLKEEFK